MLMGSQRRMHGRLIATRLHNSLKDRRTLDISKGRTCVIFAIAKLHTKGKKDWKKYQTTAVLLPRKKMTCNLSKRPSVVLELACRRSLQLLHDVPRKSGIF